MLYSSNHQRNSPPAARTLVALQPVLSRAQFPPSDQQLATRRTIGVLVPMAQHVAQVDEVQPFLPADVVGPLQGVQWQRQDRLCSVAARQTLQ
jgi:hypothetical protein